MAVAFRDYYEVLGVPRSGTPDEIKKAYRRMARKHHPDLKPAAERSKASERFKEINEAYEVLSDPEKRRRYDALGPDWKSGMEFPGGGTPGAGGARGGDGGPGAGMGGDFGAFSDFFNEIFGAGAARGARGGGARIVFPGSDVEAELPLQLDDLFRGGKRRISLPHGRTLDVDIPPGVREGTVLRLAGQGEPGMGGGPPGDLLLRIRVAPHPRYRVVGGDLEMDLPLWPWQAVLGAEIRTETPEGPVNLKVQPGTHAGRRLRLRGRGLPLGKERRGDLYAVARIVTPEHPTEGEREAYELLRRRSTAPPDRPAG